MQSKKTILVLAISLLIVIFLVSFTVTGCGRRLARKIAEEKSDVSELYEDAKEAVEGAGANDQSGESVEEDSESQAGEDSEDSGEDISENGSADDNDSSDDGEGSEEAGDDSGEDMEDEESNDEASEEAGEFNSDVPVVMAECGNIIGGVAYDDPVIYPGDNGAENQEVRGFVSFDISALAGSTVESAKISGTADRVSGTPFAAYGPLIIKAVYWGARVITPADYDLGGVEITNISKQNFGKSPDVLKSDLQNAVNSGSNRYQLCFYFEMDGTDGDGEADSITYFMDQMSLNVTYTK